MNKKPNAGDPTLERVRAAKKATEKTFSALAKVVGIGITRIRGVYGLKVNVESTPVTAAALPTEIEGIPVHVEVHEGGTITLTPLHPRPSRAEVSQVIDATMKDYARTMKKLA